MAVVGSANQCKIEAVRQVLPQFPGLAHLPVTGIAAPSGVSDQPRSLEETLAGARGRARTAHRLAEGTALLAFGIESGVFEVGADMFDVCACVAFDGVRESVGWSSAFAIPARVRAHVDGGHNLTAASNLAGLSTDPKLGEGQGLIGVLSRGRIDRLAYTMQAVLTALIGIDQPEVYLPCELPQPTPGTEPSSGTVLGTGAQGAAPAPAAPEEVPGLVRALQAQAERQHAELRQLLQAETDRHLREMAELRRTVDMLLARQGGAGAGSGSEAPPEHVAETP